MVGVGVDFVALERLLVESSSLIEILLEWRCGGFGSLGIGGSYFECLAGVVARVDCVLEGARIRVELSSVDFDRAELERAVCVLFE